MNRIVFACMLVLATAAGTVAARERPNLLPAVHSIRYGEGSVAACSLRVALPANSNAEDRVTAGELRKMLGGAKACQPAVPLTLVRTGPSGFVLPGADDSAGPESREAYRLSIRRDGVELRARTSTGLFYAAQTLRQLIDGETASIPEVEIEDWPALAYRGFMMDMAHGAVPTEAEVKRQLNFLAKWKANQYYFYAETTIELDGYPMLESAASWRPDAIRRIIGYARERHIDVVPCVELYGHLHDLFRLEHYADLAGVPHGGEINPRDPRAIALTEDWMRKLAALFPSPWFHIGLDEPWELERADPAVAKPQEYYLEQLRRLSRLAVALGKRPMFWADVAEGAYIFKKYPELYSQLPKEIIAVPWFYAALPDFTPLVKPFADHHIAQVVAPGVAIWEEVSTDYEQTLTNIDDFVAAGRRYGALGMVNTGWTDSAQAIYRGALPAVAYGAIAAWQEKPVERATFFQNYSRLEYPRGAAPDVARALTALARAQKLLQQSLGSETMFRMWDDPLAPDNLKRVAPHLGKLRELRLEVENARLHLAGAKAVDPKSPTLPSLELAARMLDFAALKYIYANEIAASFERMPRKPTREDVDFYAGRQAGARNHSRIGDLMDLAAEIPRDYEAAWLMEYRPYRLQTALGRWRAEFDYWRTLQARIWQAIREFEKNGGDKPDLQKLRGN